MKKFFSILFIFVLFLVLIMTLMNEQTTMSKIENRSLKVFNIDEITIHDFASDFVNGNLDEYIDDQLFSREELIEIIDELSYKWFDIREFGNTILGKKDYVFTKLRFANQRIEPDVETKIRTQIEKLSELSHYAHVSVILAPDQVYWDQDKLPNYYESYEPLQYDTLLGLLNESKEINVVDVHKEYTNYSSDVESYFYYANPHWNMLGTKLAISATLKQLGFDVEDIKLSRKRIDLNDEVAVKTHNELPYHYSIDASYKTIPFEYKTVDEQIVYEVNQVSTDCSWRWLTEDEIDGIYMNKYPRFKYGNVGNASIAISVNNNKDLPVAIIYHDSFAKSMPPFFNQYFSKVIYIGTHKLDSEIIFTEQPEYIFIESVPNALYQRFSALFSGDEFFSNDSDSLYTAKKINFNSGMMGYGKGYVKSAQDASMNLFFNREEKNMAIIQITKESREKMKNMRIEIRLDNEVLFEKESGLDIGNKIVFSVPSETKGYPIHKMDIKVRGDNGVPTEYGLDIVSIQILNNGKNQEQIEMDLVANHEDVRGYIEALIYNRDTNELLINGWAINKGLCSDKNTEHFVIIDGDGDKRTFQLSNNIKKGVTNVVKDGNTYDFAGYHGIIEIDDLESGEYEVTVLTKNSNVIGEIKSKKRFIIDLN